MALSCQTLSIIFRKKIETMLFLKRFLFLFLTCLLITGCVGSHTSGGNQNVFRMNLGTEPPDLDPALVRDLTSFSVIQPLMKGLTEFDQDLKVQPAIAQNWQRSPDGMTYVFNLRPDARWSDGQPVTAQQFVDAWQRVLDPKTGSEYAFFLFELKNAKAYYEGKITDFSQVGVRALNNHTLQVKLYRPTPFFPELVASPVSLPIRKDLIKKHGTRFVEAGNFISNGAYVLDTWIHEDKIILKPNPYFYGEKPKVDAVEMLMVNDSNTSVVMYENGELDFIETTTSIPTFDVRRLRKFPEAHTRPIHRLNYFGFNTQKTPMNDVRVRQAFAHALDRSYYPRLLQSGQQPNSGWISEGLVGYNPNAGLKFDPKKAQQLLAEAGYPNGEGFPSITLAYRTGYDIQKECEIAQYLWKKHLNVDVKLENMEWKVMLSRMEDDPPQIFRMGWFVDYPDADSYMAMFIKESGNNHTRWTSPEYDALIAEAVITLDAKKRQTLYDKAQYLLLDKHAAIAPIYMAEKTWLIKPYIKGLEINQMNLIDIDQLEILPH